MVALKEVNTIIAKEPYLDVGQIKIPLRKDTDCPITDYLDLELSPRSNNETKVAFPTSVISGHTVPTKFALASRLLRNEIMEAGVPLARVARPFVVASTAVLGLLALRTTTSALGGRLIIGGAMAAASAFTATTSKTGIPERLQLVSTDLLDSMTPTVRGNDLFVAKYSDS